MPPKRSASSTLCASKEIPVVIGFTIETGGRLPSGQALLVAFDDVDAETDSGTAWFIVDCAHPSYFESVLDPHRSALSDRCRRSPRDRERAGTGRRFACSEG